MKNLKETDLKNIERKLKWKPLNNSREILRLLGIGKYHFNEENWAKYTVFVGENLIPKLRKLVAEEDPLFSTLSERELIDLFYEDIKNIFLKNYESIYRNEYMVRLITKSIVKEITTDTDVHNTGEFNKAAIIERFFDKIMENSYYSYFEIEIEDENLKDRLSHLVETYLSNQ